MRLSREDLLNRSGVGEEMLSALCKAGVITTGTHGNAKIIDVTPGRLRTALVGRPHTVVVNAPYRREDSAVTDRTEAVTDRAAADPEPVEPDDPPPT